MGLKAHIRIYIELQTLSSSSLTSGKRILLTKGEDIFISIAQRGLPSTLANVADADVEAL